MLFFAKYENEEEICDKINEQFEEETLLNVSICSIPHKDCHERVTVTTEELAYSK